MSTPTASAELTGLLSFGYKHKTLGTDHSLQPKVFLTRQCLSNILIPVGPLPVVSLLCGRLDEEGVGGEGVKVDQGGLQSSAAVCE